MIDETDWESLLPEEDINLVATNWHNKFLDIMSACIPQQTLKRRRNVPWLTKDIATSENVLLHSMPLRDQIGLK